MNRKEIFLPSQKTQPSRTIQKRQKEQGRDPRCFHAASSNHQTPEDAAGVASKRQRQPDLHEELQRERIQIGAPTGIPESHLGAQSLQFAEEEVHLEALEEVADSEGVSGGGADLSCFGFDDVFAGRPRVFDCFQTKFGEEFEDEGVGFREEVPAEVEAGELAAVFGGERFCQGSAADSGC